MAELERPPNPAGRGGGWSAPAGAIHQQGADGRKELAAAEACASLRRDALREQPRSEAVWPVKPSGEERAPHVGGAEARRHATPAADEHLLEVADDLAGGVGRAEGGLVRLRQPERAERVEEEFEQELVERVDVLAELSVARAEREGKGEPLQRVGVARQREEAREQRAELRRRAEVAPALVLDAVLDELAQALGAKLS
jgi:hypothetical protein